MSKSTYHCYIFGGLLIIVGNIFYYFGAGTVDSGSTKSRLFKRLFLFFAGWLGSEQTAAFALVAVGGLIVLIGVVWQITGEKKDTYNSFWGHLKKDFFG